jgi:hypothetical protein
VDIQPDQGTQSISDDQELAKALAGISSDDAQAQPAGDSPAVPLTPPADMPANAPSMPDPTPSAIPSPQDAQPTSTPPAGAPSTPPQPAGELGSIKNDALNELRPLIDHVDLPADEKFDTYLLLIRSTDDPSLIGPAHIAAQGITDEKKKAEALLNIIKEIDYLSHKNEQSNS